MEIWNFKRQKRLIAISGIAIVALLCQLSVVFPLGQAYAEEAVASQVDFDQLANFANDWLNQSFEPVYTPQPIEPNIASVNFGALDYSSNFQPVDFYAPQPVDVAPVQDYQGYIDSGNYTYGPVSEAWYNNNVVNNTPPNYVVDWNNPASVNSWNQANPAQTYIPPVQNNYDNYLNNWNNSNIANPPMPQDVFQQQQYSLPEITQTQPTFSDLADMANQWLEQPMDGFGYAPEPIDMHLAPIAAEPVQFSHFQEPELHTIPANFGDIVHIGADDQRIVDLNEGLDGLSAEERPDYIKDHAQEYKDAGGISIFAGGGHGEIIVDANGINNPPETVAYHQGNLKEAGQNPTYAGSMDDALLTMTLYPENYTKVDDISDIVQPFSGVFSDSAYDAGTASLIAKAGKHEVYLTAAHCMDWFVEGSKFTLETQLPPEILEAPEKLAKYTRWDKIKDFIAASPGSEYRKNKAYAGYVEEYNLQQSVPEVLTFERIENNPTTDVTIFSVDRTAGEARVGDNIQIVPITGRDPLVNDKLSFYGRPIWKNVPVHAGEQLYQRWGGNVREGLVQNVNVKEIPIKTHDPSNSYQTSHSTTRGWSGSPIFKKEEGSALVSVAGTLSSGLGFVGNKSMWWSYWTKPSAIRESIEGFRQPTMYSAPNLPTPDLPTVLQPATIGAIAR